MSVTSKKEVTLKELIIKLKGWIRYLLSKWVIIGIAAAIGGAYGLYKNYYQKTIYKARITFVVENAKGGGSELGGFASQFGLDIGAGSEGETFSGANLYELLSSRSMIQKTLLRPATINGKTQSLADTYIEMKDLRKKWKDIPELANLHFPPDADPSKFTLVQNRIINGFCESISKYDMSVVSKKGLGFSSITFSAENELFAKYFEEELLRVVSAFYIETKTKKSLENFQILQVQSDSTRRVLNSAISGVADFTDANPNPNPSRMLSLRVPSQRRQIDVQASQAAYLTMVQNLESAKISLRKETPLIQVIDAPVLPLEFTETSKKEGLVYGGFIGALLGIFLLVIRKLFKDVMAG